MIPVALKKQIPFYRKRRHQQYRALVTEISLHMEILSLGEEAGVPWVEDGRNGVRLFGFSNDCANENLHDILKADLPTQLPRSHFHIVRDYVTRYIYPNLRPDLKPDGYARSEFSGFHGQHKDAVACIASPEGQQRFTQVFTPRADDIIIDGGAYIGMGDLSLSRILKRGRIIAVEAKQDCHELLARNIAYNDVTNVEAVKGALWNESACLKLHVGDAQTSSLISEFVKGDTTQKVKAWTIDDLVSHHSLDRVTMLSLTLNGAEFEALQGASSTLDRLRPRVRLAGWHERSGFPVWMLARELLLRHRYDVFVGPLGSLTALPRD
jgi:FkbM family methyltransferase